MNTKVTIKNVNGGSIHSTSPNGGSWFEFWEDHSTTNDPIICPCCSEGCTEVGGHVTIAGDSKKQYILHDVSRL